MSSSLLLFQTQPEKYMKNVRLLLIIFIFVNAHNGRNFLQNHQTATFDSQEKLLEILYPDRVVCLIKPFKNQGGSMYGRIHNFYKIFKTYYFWTLIYFHNLSFVILRNHNTLTCDSDGQITKCALASKGTQAVYCNPNPQ